MHSNTKANYMYRRRTIQYIIPVVVVLQCSLLVAQYQWLKGIRRTIQYISPVVIVLQCSLLVAQYHWLKGVRNFDG